LLRTVGVLRALPVPALEGVAHGATELVVQAGTTIVRQGDHGDRYFVFADGTVEVSHDGRPIASHGRGEGFGEIALLHDGIRTATVTATTDVRLIAVDREPFLVAVTGHRETGSRMQAVAARRFAAQVEVPIPPEEQVSG
jgi:CRP-like cAMP-binding protein